MEGAFPCLSFTWHFIMWHNRAILVRESGAIKGLVRSFSASGWIFHQQNLSVSVGAGRTGMNHTRASLTSKCFTPCSQNTRITQISAQHSAAIIQIANAEEKGEFWTKPQLLQLTKPCCPDLSYLLPCLWHSRLSKKLLKSKKIEWKWEPFNISLVFLCCH